MVFGDYILCYWIRESQSDKTVFLTWQILVSRTMTWNTSFFCNSACPDLFLRPQMSFAFVTSRCWYLLIFSFLADTTQSAFGGETGWQDELTWQGFQFKFNNTIIIRRRNGICSLNSCRHPAKLFRVYLSVCVCVVISVSVCVYNVPILLTSLLYVCHVCVCVYGATKRILYSRVI